MYFIQITILKKYILFVLKGIYFNYIDRNAYEESVYTLQNNTAEAIYLLINTKGGISGYQIITKKYYGRRKKSS